MFWKQREGGLETGGTCSAWLWGREWAKMLLPICLSGFGAVLMDFGGSLSDTDRLLLQHQALKVWS